MAGGYADPGPGRPARPVVYVDTEFGIPMIGVSKTGFRTATHAVPILRGPPRAGVTAAGMRRGDAAELVRPRSPSRPGRCCPTHGPGAGVFRDPDRLVRESGDADHGSCERESRRELDKQVLAVVVLGEGLVASGRGSGLAPAVRPLVAHDPAAARAGPAA